jgi:hypothetical protein
MCSVHRMVSTNVKTDSSLVVEQTDSTGCWCASNRLLVRKI